MNSIGVGAAKFLILALTLAPSIVFASVGLHVEAAIEHIERAIEQGEKGDAKALVVHAYGALGHANEALQEKAVAAEAEACNYMREARPQIRLAILYGRRNHIDKATEHLKKALVPLEAVVKQ